MREVMLVAWRVALKVVHLVDRWVCAMAASSAGCWVDATDDLLVAHLAVCWVDVKAAH